MLDSMTDNIKKSPEMNKYTKNFTKSSFFTIFTVILLLNIDKIQNIIEQKWLSKTQKLFFFKKTSHFTWNRNMDESMNL